MGIINLTHSNYSTLVSVTYEKTTLNTDFTNATAHFNRICHILMIHNFNKLKPHEFELHGEKGEFN